LAVALAGRVAPATAKILPAQARPFRRSPILPTASTTGDCIRKHLITDLGPLGSPTALCGNKSGRVSVEGAPMELNEANGGVAFTEVKIALPKLPMS
jgi:hypothetical protein